MTIVLLYCKGPDYITPNSIDIVISHDDDDE